MDLQLLLFLPLLPLVHSILEVHDQKLIQVLPMKEPSKQRIWSYLDGEFQLVDPGDVVEVELSLEELQASGFVAPSKKRRRRKRQSRLHEPKLMELAVYIDEDLWKHYLDKYGKDEAEPRLRTFAGVMLNTTRSLYQNPSLSPRLDISIERFEIWKDQPRALRYVNENGLDYVDRFCSFVRPRSSGFNHATLISGQRLSVGLDIDGIAWQDSVCSDSSCTVVRGAFNTAYRHGNTLAHEMGHSLGMHHDGSEDARGCDPSCCIMAPKQTGTLWSKCSNEDYQRMLRRKNCMNDRWTPRSPLNVLNGHLSNLPGQVFPDEAQCQQIVGTCFRSVPGHEGDCKRHYCSRHKSSAIMTTISEFRLDGTYCGPRKICDGGDCIRVSSHRRFQIQAVKGGWSEWRSDVEEACGDGKCSDCRIRRQRSLRAEVRRCDAPYPNNGGKPCRGAQIRGVRCSGSKKPARCRRSSSLFDSKTEYMRSKCKHSFPLLIGGTSVIFRKNNTGCDFVCHNRFLGENIPARFPDGTQCGAGRFSRGRCLHGVCMYPRCHNSNYYVSSSLDCP